MKTALFPDLLSDKLHKMQRAFLHRSNPDAEVIDISGLSVSSGFFDAHSHNDWFAIKKEPVKYFELLEVLDAYGQVAECGLCFHNSQR